MLHAQPSQVVCQAALHTAFNLRLLLQASQAERIRRDIDAFAGRVAQHKASFRSHALYKYATGYTAAYPMLDTAAAELAKLRKDCGQFAELGSVFELTELVTPITTAIKELYEDLVAVKDVWDCCMLCDVQLQVGWKACPVASETVDVHTLIC